MRQATPERIVLLALAAVIAVLFVWFQWKLIFLAFAGLLCAILLHTITRWIERHTRLGSGLSYLATMLLLLVSVAVTAILIVPPAVTQLHQIVVVLPHSLARTQDFLEQKSWGRTLLEMLQRSFHGADFGARAKDITSTLTEATVDLIVIVVIGFFGALNPRAYRNGVLSLLPEQHRDRAREIAVELMDRLRWWLLGQMVPMVVLGVATMVALWLLGVRLAFILGLFTGVMVFIPYAGTILAGIPCVLMALQRGPWIALWVVILFTIFHLVEGYLLTPMVQRRAVELPPVLTVLAQFFMWSFAGVLGVAVAAPLTAAGMVLVNELYLKPRDRRSAQGIQDISGQAKAD
ncbi:MAG: AI-2E family transporter [Acidobacteriaceae bacterium]